MAVGGGGRFRVYKGAGLNFKTGRKLGGDVLGPVEHLGVLFAKFFIRQGWDQRTGFPFRLPGGLGFGLVLFVLLVNGLARYDGKSVGLRLRLGVHHP